MPYVTNYGPLVFEYVLFAIIIMIFLKYEIESVLSPDAICSNEHLFVARKLLGNCRTVLVGWVCILSLNVQPSNEQVR